MAVVKGFGLDWEACIVASTKDTFGIGVTSVNITVPVLGNTAAEPDDEPAGVDRQTDGCGPVITWGDVGDLANSGNDS